MIRSVSDLRKELTRSSTSKRASGPFFWEADGCSIPVDFHASKKSKTLIISFHGAIDKRIRSVPWFPPVIPEFLKSAHQLCVSDPSILLKDGFSISWYAGHSGVSVQPILKKMFSDVASYLGVERTIYFGTSGGGFAALYYSWHHRGSLAVVGNPQTSIFKYHEKHKAAYLSNCWPDVEEISELKSKIDPDVCEIYSSGMQNRVIYLQNPSDQFHLYNHAIPFLSATQGKDSRDRVIFESPFTGATGHNPVWSVYKPWIQAALLSPSWHVRDVFSTRAALMSAPVVNSPSESRSTSSAPPPADLRMADLLRDLHLKS